MITISLCMIVKNEEEVLHRCLDSVYDIVDEINIVDTGSTDQTINIAKTYTNCVFSFPWTGKFKDARNESFKYATKDYILYLDADDVLLPADRSKLRELKETLDMSVDAASMYYHAGVDEFDNVTLRYRRNRLVKRSRHFRWKGDCHNYLSVGGNILNTTIAITHLAKRHHTKRNLRIYKERLNNGDTFSPRDYFYYGNELRENGYYELAIESYEKNMNMKQGWIADKIFASIFRADCYNILGKRDKRLVSLLDALILSSDSPRAEIYCRIALYYQEIRDFRKAIKWYSLATNIREDPSKWSFTYLAYYTWYPHMQLFNCFYNLKQFKRARKHNNKALTYRQDPLLLFNDKLLNKQ